MILQKKSKKMHICKYTFETWTTDIWVDVNWMDFMLSLAYEDGGGDGS
jgi:hypothetical protein